MQVTMFVSEKAELFYKILDLFIKLNKKLDFIRVNMIIGYNFLLPIE